MEISFWRNFYHWVHRKFSDWLITSAASDENFIKMPFLSQCKTASSYWLWLAYVHHVNSYTKPTSLCWNGPCYSIIVIQKWNWDESRAPRAPCMLWSTAAFSRSTAGNEAGIHDIKALHYITTLNTISTHFTHHCYWHVLSKKYNSALMAFSSQLVARGWFNIKIPSYHYRNSPCGDKTIVR